MLKAERSYDIAAVVTFDSLADLGVYAKHPKHLEILAFLKDITDSVVSVDFET